MTLCLFLERGTDSSLGTRLHRRMIAQPVFHRLEPPLSRGRTTVVQVPLEGEPKVARDAAYDWADGVWTAWADHHSTVRDWVNRSGIGAKSLGWS